MNQNKRGGISFSLMLLDLLSLLCCFFSIDFLSQLILNKEIYMSYDVIIDLLGPIFISYALIFVFFNQNQVFLTRGYFEELLYVIKINVLYSFAILSILFWSKNTLSMARTGLYGALILDVLFMYALHCLFKLFLRHWYNSKKHYTHVLLVTS